jgi:hypothetical protein
MLTQCPRDPKARNANCNNATRSSPISLADIFSGGRDWKKFAAGYCNKDLRRQVADDNMPTDFDISDIGAAVAKDGNWLWSKDSAIAMFTISMNSGMPDAPYEMRIPYTALKPFMKPDAPVL